MVGGEPAPVAGAGGGRRPRRAHLHGHPPLTPAGALLGHRLIVPCLIAAFAVLALAASVDDGAALRVVDEPVQRAVEGRRTPALDRAMAWSSDLGGLSVVVIGLAGLLLAVWRRCHSLALVLLCATVARPLLEWTLKELVGRPRPDFERLVPGTGMSFPSGHVMAAVALWGLVPPVVALATNRRRWWWWSVVLSGLAVGVVAASRVYLGVHWLSDVVGALLLGSLYLLSVEWLLEWHHRRRPCPALDEVHEVWRGAPRSASHGEADGHRRGSRDSQASSRQRSLPW